VPALARAMAGEVPPQRVGHKERTKWLRRRWHHTGERRKRRELSDGTFVEERSLFLLSAHQRMSYMSAVVVWPCATPLLTSPCQYCLMIHA